MMISAPSAWATGAACPVYTDTKNICAPEDKKDMKDYIKPGMGAKALDKVLEDAAEASLKQADLCKKAVEQCDGQCGEDACKPLRKHIEEYKEQAEECQQKRKENQKVADSTGDGSNDKDKGKDVVIPGPGGKVADGGDTVHIPEQPLPGAGMPSVPPVSGGGGNSTPAPPSNVNPPASPGQQTDGRKYGGEKDRKRDPARMQRRFALGMVTGAMTAMAAGAMQSANKPATGVGNAAPASSTGGQPAQAPVVNGKPEGSQDSAVTKPGDKRNNFGGFMPKKDADAAKAAQTASASAGATGNGGNGASTGGAPTGGSGSGAPAGGMRGFSAGAGGGGEFTSSGQAKLDPRVPYDGTPRTDASKLNQRPFGVNEGGGGGSAGGGARNAGNRPLADYLPTGSQYRPQRGPAGMDTEQAGIQSKAVDIWGQITNRFHIHCLDGRLRDCRLKAAD